MCGECFLLFPTTEDFNAHQCQGGDVDKVEDVAAEGVEDHKPSTSGLDVPQSTECVHIGIVYVFLRVSFHRQNGQPPLGGHFEASPNASLKITFHVL